MCNLLLWTCLGTAMITGAAWIQAWNATWCRIPDSVGVASSYRAALNTMTSSASTTVTSTLAALWVVRSTSCLTRNTWTEKAFSRRRMLPVNNALWRWTSSWIVWSCLAVLAYVCRVLNRNFVKHIFHCTLFALVLRWHPDSSITLLVKSVAQIIMYIHTKIEQCLFKLQQNCRRSTLWRVSCTPENTWQRDGLVDYSKRNHNAWLGIKHTLCPGNVCIFSHWHFCQISQTDSCMSKL